VQVLPDATTDHHPLLLTVDACRISGSNNSNSNTKMVNSRNFKAVGTAELEAALEQTWNWGDVHVIRDVNKVHAFVLGGITAALDIVAPLKEIRVKKGTNIYLATETLGVIKQRDDARGDPDPTRYRDLRNRVTRRVRRDKLRSNISTLSKAAGDPRVLWQLANAALGNPRATLPRYLSNPNGSKTIDDKSAANLMAGYYTKKVLDLRDQVADAPEAPTPGWPPVHGRGKTFRSALPVLGKWQKQSRNQKTRRL
jgi:hypothetical protein